MPLFGYSKICKCIFRLFTLGLEWECPLSVWRMRISTGGSPHRFCCLNCETLLVLVRGCAPSSGFVLAKQEYCFILSAGQTQYFDSVAVLWKVQYSVTLLGFFLCFWARKRLLYRHGDRSEFTGSGDDRSEVLRQLRDIEWLRLKRHNPLTPSCYSRSIVQSWALAP